MAISKIIAFEDRMEKLGAASLTDYVLNAIPDDDERAEAAEYVMRHDTGTRVLSAEVIGGRWIVRCADCSGAQFASRHDRRFFCTHCFNQSIGHLWASVTWPSDEDVAAIERTLLARPNPRNRNWLPHETPDDLLRENLAHDIGADR